MYIIESQINLCVTSQRTSKSVYSSPC